MSSRSLLRRAERWAADKSPTVAVTSEVSMLEGWEHVKPAVNPSDPMLEGGIRMGVGGARGLVSRIPASDTGP